MKLYLDNGYVNIPGILQRGLPFNFCVGGRGTGKTFMSLRYLKEIAINTDRKFVFLRRTQTQVDLISKPEYSPFKAIDEFYCDYTVVKPVSKYTSAFYDGKVGENGIEAGQLIGYVAALSTISNLRGFSAVDVDYILYDEFIPERHEKKIKDEGAALLNCYETINRNRELSGKKPVQLLCLANAFDLGNPIFTELNLVRSVEKMRKTGQEQLVLKDRGVAVYLLDKSSISSQKANTALYKLTKNSDFAQMALKNDFAYDKASKIKSIPLGELIPVVAVGEVCVYQHKANNSIYVSSHKSGSPVTFSASDSDLARFKHAFSWVWFEYLRNNIIFEDYMCELLLTKYFD